MGDLILIGLDRDGTINYDSGYFGKDQDWKQKLKLYSGVIEGIRLLNKIPRTKIVVATNQAGVARGYFGVDRVIEINKYLDDYLRSNGAIIDDWQFCPFVSESYAIKKGFEKNEWVKETDLRKPRIGMLKESAKNLGYNLKDFKEIYFIGDKVDDVKTGINVNGKGILISNGDIDKELSSLLHEYPSRIYITDNFLGAVKFIL